MSYNAQKSKKVGKTSSGKIRTENKSGYNKVYSSKGSSNLNIMLKDYKIFCEKYFGNTTPIAAIDQNQFDKMINENDENKEEKEKYNLNDNEIIQIQNNPVKEIIPTKSKFIITPDKNSKSI